jgi:hypothetical protein
VINLLIYSKETITIKTNKLNWKKERNVSHLISSSRHTQRRHMSHTDNMKHFTQFQEIRGSVIAIANIRKGKLGDSSSVNNRRNMKLMTIDYQVIRISEMFTIRLEREQIVIQERVGYRERRTIFVKLSSDRGFIERIDRRKIDILTNK